MICLPIFALCPLNIDDGTNCIHLQYDRNKRERYQASKKNEKMDVQNREKKDITIVVVRGGMKRNEPNSLL